MCNGLIKYLELMSHASINHLLVLCHCNLYLFIINVVFIFLFSTLCDPSSDLDSPWWGLTI